MSISQASGGWKSESRAPVQLYYDEMLVLWLHVGNGSRSINKGTTFTMRGPLLTNHHRKVSLLMIIVFVGILT